MPSAQPGEPLFGAADGAEQGAPPLQLSRAQVPLCVVGGVAAALALAAVHEAGRVRG